MSTLTLRSTKGTPLTIAEVDTNFSNLNTDKIETADAVSANTATKVVRRDASGNFSAGVITVTDLNSTSDRNLKQDIAPITSATDIIEQLNGVSFTWKSTGNKSYGVIAQELEQVLPELVTRDADGVLSVSYTPLIAILVEAIKSQETRINELEAIVNKS